MRAFLFIIPIIFLLKTVAIAQGGGLGAYVDYQQHFWVFDHGKFKKLESQPIQEYKVSRNYVAYISKVGQLKAYYNGKSRILTENFPDFYHVTDNLLFFGLGSTFYTFEDNKINRLGSWAGPNKVYGDSMVAMFDYFQFFMVWYQGELHELDAFQIHDVKLGSQRTNPRLARMRKIR